MGVSVGWLCLTTAALLVLVPSVPQVTTAALLLLVQLFYLSVCSYNLYILVLTPI
jgi:hypothetical protein